MRIKATQLLTRGSLLLVLLSFVNCTQSKAFDSPGDYDLAKPLTYPLEDKLKEISGISFRPGDDEVIYAIEDEHARMFRINPEGRVLSVSDFGKKGDYEDVALTKNASFVLRSDGVIFGNSIATGNDPNESAAFEGLVPDGEYEGLMSSSDSMLVMLCKNCKIKKDKGIATVYKIRLDSGKPATNAEAMRIDLSSIDQALLDRKFSPSALAINPVTGQWYILSSVNKLLVVLEPDLTSPKAFPLDLAIFPQPEGLCFDSKANLYISNEAVTGPATLLKFMRKGK